MNTYPLTDLGNSQRFIREYHKIIRYCGQGGGWYIWNNKIWEVDTQGKIFELIKQTTRDMLTMASQITDDDRRRRLVQFALQSQSDRSMRAIENMSKTDGSIVCKAGIFNTNRELISCRNGTVNICTGEYREHRQGDMITQMVDIKYDANAKCPQWKKFISEIMCGNNDLVEYLQKAIGYSLTGYVSESKVFIPYGGGGNGKSKMLLVIRKLFSPFVIESPPSLLLLTNNERHPTEIADLCGVRMVIAIETNKGVKFNEARVKQLTGGDIIRARFLYKDFFEFEPTHTIWLATNNRPEIGEISFAMIRRLAEIPFKARFDPEDPNTDINIEDKLILEDSGIFKWVVDGCMKWRKDGLKMPDEIKAAVNEYVEEMDVIQHFINDCCDTGPKASILAEPLYKKYKDWTCDTGEQAMKYRPFIRDVEGRGYEKVRIGSDKVGFRGIELKAGLS